MIAKINSAALYGIDACNITIEVSIGKGIGYQMTGQADVVVKESLSRIDTALTNAGFQMPRTKMAINLAPASVRKTGSAFDLPIAAAILLASRQLIDLDKLKDYVIIGEMGLDGKIYTVRGALCIAHHTSQQGFKGILLPQANAAEASLVCGIEVYGFNDLADFVSFIGSDIASNKIQPAVCFPFSRQDIPDFKEVKGQPGVKRALEIAAAGGHNALIIGCPGIGKTMLARRLPSILPPMTLEEALETTRIYSVLNNNEPLRGLIMNRPFRSPHHIASETALAGGGSIPVPGEISLAHNGVLFLDELPEFRRNVIEVLRLPMEERRIVIARAKLVLEFPASFLFLGSMNPCPCGYFNHPYRPCTCSRNAIYRYHRKISGPLMERIDLHIEAESLPVEQLIDQPVEESSAIIRERVIRARHIQTARFHNHPQIHNNAQMPDSLIETFCLLEPAARKFLLKNVQTNQLSARSYMRILKISRTIADLAATYYIELPHVAEALHLRNLDKPFIVPGDRKLSAVPMQRFYLSAARK